MVSLLNSLSMALPLSEQDKQALLETVEPTERLYAFTALLDSELQTPGPVTRH
jgi:Lon protease-like protein